MIKTHTSILVFQSLGKFFSNTPSEPLLLEIHLVSATMGTEHRKPLYNSPYIQEFVTTSLHSSPFNRINIPISLLTLPPRITLACQRLGDGHGRLGGWGGRGGAAVGVEQDKGFCLKPWEKPL